MLQRIEVALKPEVKDVVGQGIKKKISDFLKISVQDVRIIKVFTVQGLAGDAVERVLENAALHDPVLHTPSLDPLAADFDWVIEVGFRPGVTDNEGRTAREAIALVAGLDAAQADDLAVYTANQYVLRGDLDAEQVERIGRDLLANVLIQRFEFKSSAQWRETPGFAAKAARVSGQAIDSVETIDLQAMDDAELEAFSRKNVLALNLTEMHAIRDYFARSGVRGARRQKGFPELPTDAEIECLAQTWSEHCKHKIFSARIRYTDHESNSSSEIDSLYKTYIQNTTAALRKIKGKGDFCLSVFKDNAGVISLSDEHNVCIKVETHNSPSALDPYGGALTGIVGVNRDPMGTGLGARMLCNTDVFCFASPFHQGELPPRLLHPRRVLEGVREGVEHGGNKSGIPTVNGSLVFDQRYLGKPLVFCGTVGILPKEICGRPSYEKAAQPGDAVVMVGGRIGKDGIHGATFSSEELHEESPATAVQIGDPITQRKLYDFLMRARDMGLYNAITDNGAGGLSSSVGEMAEDTNGVLMDLAKAPLKYDGLRPWEILLSEAQERMTVAVPQDKLEEFLALSREMSVESTCLGEYTQSGCFEIRYGGKPVALLDMDFLHHGVPQLELEAVWEKPQSRSSEQSVAGLDGEIGQGGLLHRMLGRLNICSKEYIVRQYDHEVKGASVVKPLVGALRDGPSDAGVMRPVLERPEGLVISHGICPKFSDLDTYWMMANAVDEAVRNAVAVGADLRHMAGVDNFCWCDPVQSEKTPDGRYKLAQLVRANQALAHFCLGFGVPCISGKDSMKNDYTGGGQKISIPPTVLFSVIGVVPDAAKAVSSDFKQPGDRIYLLGMTRSELGGSELASELGINGGSVPEVEVVPARERYLAVHRAMNSGLINACHDLSDGGLAVALAEMAIGGRLGAHVDLENVPAPAAALTTTDVLYSESASRLLVTVPETQAQAFEALFAGQCCGLLGAVAATDTLELKRGQQQVLCETVADLMQSWKNTLDW